MTTINRWSDNFESPDNYPIKTIGTNDVWIQKDGTPIRIVDMTDEHIRNCIAFIGNSDLELKRLFQQELERRK